MALFLAANYSFGQISDLDLSSVGAFKACKFERDEMFIQIEGSDEWLQLLQVGDFATEDLVRYIKELYGMKWERSLSRDFVSIINFVGLEIESPEINVTVKDASGQTQKRFLPLNKSNRSDAKDYYDATHQENVSSDSISKREAIEDIDQVFQILSTKHSYAQLEKINYQEELEKLKDELAANVSVCFLTNRLEYIINRLGDGHASVSSSQPSLKKTSGRLPFRTVYSDGRIVCLHGTEEELLNKEYPYLKEVNEVSVDQVLQTAFEMLPDVSEQFKQFYGAKMIKYIGYILSENDIEIGSMVTVTLENENGRTIEYTAKVDYEIEKSNQGRLAMLKMVMNAFDHELIDDGEIGYMRISKMFLLGEAKVHKAMKEFRNTKGMIIDIRGNSGGNRLPLMALAPYFIDSNSSPVVVNVAKFRTDSPNELTGEYLFDRYLFTEDFYYKSDSSAYNAIQDYKKTFSPEWDVDSTKFSNWHYAVISPKKDENYYYYNKPVIVLMDSYCFSASDIFLAGLKEFDNVTLVGSKSGGGSGRSVKYELSNSKIHLKLSTMVSYQPNGQLYDGNGVDPDIEINSTLESTLNKELLIQEMIKRINENAAN